MSVDLLLRVCEICVLQRCVTGFSFIQREDWNAWNYSVLLPVLIFDVLPRKKKKSLIEGLFYDYLINRIILYGEKQLLFF